MSVLHKIVDLLFTKFPKLGEFCFLALPLSSDKNGVASLYNAELWNKYPNTRAHTIKLCSLGMDLKSKIWIRRLMKRRTTIRYFLSLSEIVRYYQAKHLKLPYWFPDNGTLLKSVFLCKAGLVHLPHKELSTIKDRIAIDGGAASGDSSIVLLECGASKVIAFEPSPRQRDEMSVVFRQNHLSGKIDIAPFALGENAGIQSFGDQYGVSFTANTISIDEYCRNKDIGCIKLDIEGAEFPTIRGAAKTIARCHPILLICVYHRPEDLFELPLWIYDHFPFYNFRIRETEPGNYGVGAHLMLIAWPSDNTFLIPSHT